MLHNRSDTLQTHTGIYRWLWQWQQSAVSLTVELHEHVVPNLDITVAIFFWTSWRTAPDVIAVVIENLGARTAWAGITHLPEVIGGIRRTFVVTDTHDALFWNANFFGPDVIRFIIRGVHRYPQLLFRQCQPLWRRQELPRIANRIVLEVIAEAEVTQHFEEGVVTRGITYVL